MRIFLFFMLFSLQGFGQNALTPFEFERQLPSYYQNALMRMDANFESEKEALNYYMTAYKLQRAESPADYFIEPNHERNLARNYITAFHSGGFSLALVEFLETGGSRIAALKLTESEISLPVEAFYKYLGAKIVKQNQIAQETLQTLDKSKLISPVTKAFGLNAVQSAEGKTIIATQGFQDLLAIDYGLMKLNKKNIRVLNFFLESLPENLTPKISLELRLDAKRVWISPTVSTSFIAMHREKLWTEGIGLQLYEEDALDVIAAELKMDKLSRQFEGIGEKPFTPADRGLIRSYASFADAYYQLAQANNDKKQSAKADKLKKYIQPYLNE